MKQLPTDETNTDKTIRKAKQNQEIYQTNDFCQDLSHRPNQEQLPKAKIWHNKSYQTETRLARTQLAIQANRVRP